MHVSIHICMRGGVVYDHDDDGPTLPPPTFGTEASGQLVGLDQRGV
jgi:hypothetical protein